MPFTPSKFTELQPDHRTVLRVLDTPQTFQGVIAASGLAGPRTRGVLTVLSQRHLVLYRLGRWERTDAGTRLTDKFENESQ